MEKTEQHLWHAIPLEEVLKILKTDATKGLSSEEAKERQKFYGKNTLPEEKVPSRLQIFLHQFKNPLVFILVLAGIVTILLGEYKDSIVIFSAVLLNTSIGYFQENRATRTLAELKKALKVRARVLRNGNEKEIVQEDLVPGDIIILETGSKVPADGRIIESWKLGVQEAVLTGEWMTSFKTNKVLEPSTPLADRENMVFMGSIVQEGRGKAVVTGIGKQSEVGKVAQLVKGIREEETPYQTRLVKFSHLIGRIIALLVLFIFLEGVIVGRDPNEMFKVAVAIAVGAIPEGLPVAITAILAMGMQRILKAGGLVRNLAASETLGSATVIATDKTLTLTEGIMEVDAIWTLHPDQRDLALKIAGLASEAFVENPEAIFEKWQIKGRPTDKALLKAALESGILKPTFAKETSPIWRIPFESTRKYSASFYQQDNKIVGYLLGAPETIFSLSNLSQDEILLCEKKLDEFAKAGLRVVGMGEKSFSPELFLHSDHQKIDLKNINFVGLIALKDPLRKGVKEAIKIAKEAGVRTIIVTGDHVLTAVAVAKEIGLESEKINVIEGKELEDLSEETLASRLQDINVYARVEPKHKLKIIEAWQKSGAVIAMTGDGINDAPALKKADIGIVLGSGTDVAKEAGDLVLIEDKFSIIPHAIKEGRIIIDNIRKVITYLLSGSFTETILVGASLAWNLPLPITASQILWINLVEDGLPGLALTFEKGDKNVMSRLPEGKNIALLTSPMKVIIFAVGIFTDFILLGLFLLLLNFSTYSISHIRTIIFVGLAIDSLFYVFSCKNLGQNLWKYNPFSNQYLNLGVIFALILLLLAVYAPPLQNLFHTQPLYIIDWIVLLGLALLNVFLIEIAKWIFVK